MFEKLIKFFKDEIYLVDLLLHIEGKLNGRDRALPLLLDRSVDSIEHNPATTKVLELDKLLGSLVLHLSQIGVELREALQANIIPVIIGSLYKRNINIFDTL